MCIVDRNAFNDALDADFTIVFNGDVDPCVTYDDIHNGTLQKNGPISVFIYTCNA